MLLFSAILKINNTMGKDDFIRLALEWNQSNPRKENIIPGIEWNGEHNVRYGDDDLWLDIEEYRNQNIIAVRYEKTAPDGAVWDTDYVMNFNSMELSVRLDRSYLESAMTIDPKFSTPHFISLLIEHGYLADDGILPVSNKPMLIDEENLQVLADIINGDAQYRLPIVYISKTFNNEDPVEIGWMASRLKGVAHVLVQKDNHLNTALRNACNDQNEYYGAIGVYYPKQAMSRKRFLYRQYEGFDDILMEKVIRSVILYSNSQMVEPLFTWSGVNNALLRDKYSSQKEERIAAEKAKQKAYDDADELLSSVDEEIKELKRQVSQLTKANDALTYENQGLKTKLDSSEAVPLIYLGDEDELFQGEIKDMILEILSDTLKNTAPKTRRSDVLSDIISKNNYEELLKKREASIKALFKDHKGMTGTLRQDLVDMGFIIAEEGKHYKLTYYGDGRYRITLSKTPSDHREGRNTASTIIKNLF